MIGTERGAAPCTPRARLNGAAALCAAAATLAGEVLCCPTWVSADMFNLHKIVIVGERYDQHLDFGIDTIVEQTHGSRFWWTDRIGHVQSMILTQHVVFYFRHQELHDLVILFFFQISAFVLHCFGIHHRVSQ